jgi:hypothetical protein
MKYFYRSTALDDSTKNLPVIQGGMQWTGFSFFWVVQKST